MTPKRDAKAVTNMAEVLEQERADPDNPEDLGAVLDERVAFSKRGKDAEDDPSAVLVDETLLNWASDGDDDEPTPETKPEPEPAQEPAPEPGDLDRLKQFVAALKAAAGTPEA